MSKQTRDVNIDTNDEMWMHLKQQEFSLSLSNLCISYIIIFDMHMQRGFLLNLYDAPCDDTHCLL